ncbi:MAG: HU family DNA-binding protein [Ignavibacteriaceae bacterium]
MTKAELIRKIAKRAGVPDSEAKVFFEIFLKKSSDLLSPGEAIFLKGFGHFQLRKGKIRTSIPETESSDKDSIFVELMVYYPTKLREEEVKEEIVFNVPVLKYEKYNPLDSHFSLSIGKPVIPVEGVNSSDFFIPLTGQELRKLVESRVDKLIADIEIVKEYTKGNEVLIIDTDSIKSHQLEFNWGEVPSKNISDSKLTAKSKDVANVADEPTEEGISWDFGEDISKEIVEDSILDVEKEEISIIGEQYYEEAAEETVEEKPDWNFGITMVDEGESDPEENIEEGIIKEANAGIVESDVARTFAETQNPLIIDDIDLEERFERVRSFSSYFEEDELTKLPDSSSYKYMRDPDVISLEDYETDEQTDVDDNEFQSQGKNLESQPERKDEINTNEQTNNLDNIIKVEAPETEVKDEEVKKNRKSKLLKRVEERQSSYSREGVYPVFIIALIVIVAIAIAVYFYITKAFVSTNNNETKPPVNSKVVQRNNENAKTIESKQTSENNSDGSLKVTKKNDASSLTIENLPAPVDTSLLHEDIAFGKNTYTAQVSSWQSRAAADQQVAKFKAKGYDAYIEKANIPGKGIWYRVKVRNFKSMREAEDFLLSNQ